MENKSEVVMEKPSYHKLLIAYLVDYIGVRMITLPLVYTLFLSVIYKLMGWQLTFPAPVRMGVGKFLCWVLFILYFACLEQKAGTSLGKQVMKIRVVSLTEKPLKLGRLFVAYTIDSVLAGVIASIFTFGMVFSTASVLGPARSPLLTAIVLGSIGAVFFMAWYIFYFAACEHKYGYGAGKKLMGLTVVQDAPDTQEQKVEWYDD